MTEQEYKQFKEFVKKLIYKVMTLDDYEIIMNRLGCPKPIKSNSQTWMYKSICHNVNPNNCKNNLAFYTENKSFYCFSDCQVSYNIVTLVEKRFELLEKPKSRIQCVKWICEQLNVNFDFKDDGKIVTNNNKYDWQTDLNRYIRIKHGEAELKEYDKKILNYFEECYPQSWIDEGISLDTMYKYKIRYYPIHDSVVIPCFQENGTMCGIRERFLNPNSKVKYLPLSMLNGDSFEFPVNKTLYGLNYNAENIRHYGKVVLFESEKSTMQCDTFFGCKNFSVSLYGKSMSMSKVKQILELEPNEVIICLDADYDSVYEQDNQTFTKEFISFTKNVRRIAQYFKPYCKVTSTVIYGEHPRNCSPSDLGKEKYLELFNQREDCSNIEL